MVSLLAGVSDPAAPVLFRATCYYYRKAYYRSYFLDPPACAVSELRGTGYRGETAFPLILQNLHRYLFYITLLYLPFLWTDVARATVFNGSFGIGVGTLVLFANTVASRSIVCRAIRRATWWAAGSIASAAAPSTRHATAPGRGRACSMTVTCCSLG